MPVLVSGSSSSRFRDQLANLRRDYAVPAYSTPKRNTFTASTVAVHPPAIDFISAGAAAETNKLCEIPVEVFEATSAGSERFGGPGYTVDYDFAQLFSCNHQGGMATIAQVANVGADAWTGIELYSAENNTLTTYPTVGNGWVSLRRSVKDPRNYSLQVRNTSGNPQGKVDFTVAPQGTSGIDPLIPEPHSIALYWDPFAPQIQALVNGVVRATLGFAAVPGGGLTLGNWIECGLVVWSGTQSGATKIFSQWSGIQVVSFNTNQIGSGLV